MKLTVFDVSNGSCYLVVDNNGNSLMIDCGGHGEKDCPVELINIFRQTSGWLESMKCYHRSGIIHPLTELQVTHPDLDHIKNIEKVHKHLPPLMLHRTYLSEYISEEIENESDALSSYKEVDSKYTLVIANDPTFPRVDWSFIHKKAYRIIPSTVRETYSLSAGGKIKNNSSFVTLLVEDNVSILFGGDLEQEGWKYLIENNIDGFADDIKKFGVDIFVAPHHGHHSGYSPELFELMGNPKLSILSKGSEEGEDSDVSPNYSRNSLGTYHIHNLKTKSSEQRSTLTTRYDGHIFIETKESLQILTGKYN